MKAISHSKKMGDNFVSVDHLLISLIDSNSELSKVLNGFGYTAQKVKNVLSKMRQGDKVKSSSDDDNFNALDKYAINLVSKATDGKLDPVIGKINEIRRTYHYL